jgi:hypothetical protein
MYHYYFFKYSITLMTKVTSYNLILNSFAIALEFRRRTRYLLDIYISFCCLFSVDILQISFKYIQKHHPFNISIKRLENIFIKKNYVRYLKCIVKI